MCALDESRVLVGMVCAETMCFNYVNYVYLGVNVWPFFLPYALPYCCRFPMQQHFGFISGHCLSLVLCTHLPGIRYDNNTGNCYMNSSMCCNQHVYLQVHVKATEKGHPLAASKAAWSSPSSPYTPGPALQPPSASQQAYPVMQPGMPGMQNLAMGMQAGVSGMAWGGYGSLDAAKGYSGLDGVGQALSAALQVDLYPIAFTPLGLSRPLTVKHHTKVSDMHVRSRRIESSLHNSRQDESGLAKHLQCISHAVHKSCSASVMQGISHAGHQSHTCVACNPENSTLCISKYFLLPHVTCQLLTTSLLLQPRRVRVGGMGQGCSP